MTIQEILELWIEKGAVYKGEDIKSIVGNGLRLSIRTNHEYTADVMSLYDILYGDSNFWEVMFPGWNGLVSYDHEDLDDWIDDSRVDTGTHREQSKAVLFKMQSTLHKDKVKYISNLLSDT